MVSDLPVGVWVILIYQFLERFAFFGIKSTLELYLTSQLGYSEEQSTSSTSSCLDPISQSFLAFLLISSLENSKPFSSSLWCHSLAMSSIPLAQ